jgi:hypothetical protein
MNKRSFGAKVLVASIFATALVAGGQDPGYKTALTPDGRGIVRHPPAADFAAGRGKLDKLPVFDPDSKNGWQVDLRSRDLSALDLAGRLQDLLFADFDSRTVWPKALPNGFDPAALMDIGKNPGLGVRALHRLGITGNGVGVAIIDQALLVDHVEYRDRLRLYEEIHNGDERAAMHGPAVASIAVGTTVGVAPGADLYYIAETHGSVESGKFVLDFVPLARSIDRILEVNRSLPADRKIRVLSISVGWSPRQKGYAEVTAALERAKKDGVFVVSSSVSATYDGKFNFHGLGRNPQADPEDFRSYGPGLWWMDQFWGLSAGSPALLLIPMDSRATASPTGNDDYVFYRQGGWSWSIPYLAGLYALACQVEPGITPEVFWAKALATGDSVEIPARRSMPSQEELARQIDRILDEQIAFMKQRSPDVPLEKTMAEAYSRLSGKKVETISESDFRTWAAAGPIREMAVGDTKPKTLKTIINPAKLIEALRKSAG